MNASFNRQIFPEMHYRERFRAFAKSKDIPCGIGCAYNCCDPIITSVILRKRDDEGNLFNSIQTASTSLQKDIEGDRDMLSLSGYFIAPSFFKKCFDPGPDFGIRSDAETLIQVYVLFRCPKLLRTGLCSVYGGQRLRLCEEFKGCPEYRITDRTSESVFVTLSFHYWLMRKLITDSCVQDVNEALRTWKNNEKKGIKFFLRQEDSCCDMIHNQEFDK